MYFVQKIQNLFGHVAQMPGELPKYFCFLLVEFLKGIDKTSTFWIISDRAFLFRAMWSIFFTRYKLAQFEV